MSRHHDRSRVPSKRVPAQLPHVLLIEDDQSCAEAMTRVLRGRFEITTRDTALGGLLAFEELEPQAVVVDYDLPDIDGVQLARVMRGCSLRDVPIVIVSAHAPERVPFERVGAVFLEKPFDAHLLGNRLCELLQRGSQVD